MNIYSIKDLISKNFDDEEIDLVNKSLQYSLVIGMFNHTKIDLSQKEIIDACKKDGWYDKWQWSELQQSQYKDKLVKIFYNLYRFGPIKCENSAQDWIIRYGFQLKAKPKKKYDKSKVHKH